MFPDIHFPFRKKNAWSTAVFSGVLIPTVVKFKGKFVFLYLELKQTHSFTFNKYMEINML